MIRHSTIRLTTALVITSAGAIAAIMTGRPEAALLAAPWAVLLALGLSGATRQRVEGAISVDADRVLVGDRITTTIELTGASGWVRATVRPGSEFWPDRANDAGLADVDTESVAITDEPDRLSVADVAHVGRTTELHCTMTARAWGTHDVGRVGIEVNEPYGLLRWTGSFHQHRPVRVHPLPVDIQRLLAPWYVRRLTGGHNSRTVGRGVEYADIRQFGAGDSVRDINWRASARTQELWVSDRHPDRSTDVVLLMDTFTESGHDIRTILGLAIEAAMALSESHLAVTDRVGLIELGGIIRWVSPGTGAHQMQRLVDAILSTRLYDNASERQLTVIPPRALPPRSFIVALSPLLDPRFLDSLQLLRGAGHDVSVIECPPIITEPTDEPVTDSQRVARKLWEAERTATNDRLVERGIAVSPWAVGDHLDQTLADLIRRRRGVRAAVAR